MSDRINRLASRFNNRDEDKTPTEDLPEAEVKVKKPTQDTTTKETEKKRTRQSFYLDATLFPRLDEAYREMSHKLYPRKFSKVEFLEVFFEFGLSHISDIETTISGKETS